MPSTPNPFELEQEEEEEEYDFETDEEDDDDDYETSSSYYTDDDDEEEEFLTPNGRRHNNNSNGYGDYKSLNKGGRRRDNNDGYASRIFWLLFILVCAGLLVTLVVEENDKGEKDFGHFHIGQRPLSPPHRPGGIPNYHSKDQDNNARKHHSNNGPSIIRILGERNSGTHYIEEVLRKAYYPEYAGTKKPGKNPYPFSGCPNQFMLGGNDDYQPHHARKATRRTTTAKTTTPTKSATKKTTSSTGTDSKSTTKKTSSGSKSATEKSTSGSKSTTKKTSSGTKSTTQKTSSGTKSTTKEAKTTGSTKSTTQKTTSGTKSTTKEAKTTSGTKSTTKETKTASGTKSTTKESTGSGSKSSTTTKSSTASKNATTQKTAGNKSTTDKDTGSSSTMTPKHGNATSTTNANKATTPTTTPEPAKHPTPTESEQEHNNEEEEISGECTPVFKFKHMFRHSLLTDDERSTLKADNKTLWILMVRSPCDWVDGMYRKPWHLCPPNNPSRCPGPYIGLNETVLHNVTRESFLTMPWSDYVESTNMGNDPEQENNFTYESVFALRSHKLRLMKQLIDSVPHQVKVVHLKDLERNPERVVQDLKLEFNLQLKTLYKPQRPSLQFHKPLCLNENEWKIAQQQIDWELEGHFGFNHLDCHTCYRR